MIKVKNLSKHYGSAKAVDDISFEVAEHENLILLGTSGCGKTTTLKMLNRLVEPTHGEIFINGKNVNQQPPEQLRRGIGYVLQNNGLFPHYTIAENIAIVPKLLKWDAKRINTRMHELVEKLHLSVNFLNHYPNQLSGGQQQRIGLARALMADTPVLLMDEPFGALDNITRGKIQAEFKQLDELQRKTIVMVTHDVQEAFELGNRIALMDQGHLIQLGTPAELLFNPANEFVKEFMQAQRLQLELKALTLDDLWSLLPPSFKNTHNYPVIDSSNNVWAAMEAFKLQNAQVLNIKQPEKDEKKAITFEQLMSAFYAYQNKR
ncbi:ATP-binding cassette domain-containing protein [Mucilaginibacter robiniae]|uniref:ATP-binding cassette domain-containing protein n=1 Tax=Mucilaginibacter robiniae TaxID=2728022 RepID=A0A7L5DWC4_9SPHI|nr:ATP-binding cassette domain-containing protein [Mucilaginibacter robiniae]QJD95390.1 ATP-binding cassette domain-containing protein [Mucilaginibacter robiniae]